MTWWQLILRSLRYHWRSSLSVLAGTAVAGAVLTGALLVGDSVRASLRRQAGMRLGQVAWAIDLRGHFFQADLADRIAGDLVVPTASATATASHSPAAGLHLAATARQPDNGREAHSAQVYGVDDRFWAFSPGGQSPAIHPAAPAGSLPPGESIPPDGAVIDTELARHLDLHVGDPLVLRVDNPGWMSRDAPLSTTADDSIPLRVTVMGMAADESFGRFELPASQNRPRNIFVSRTWLQGKLARPGQANLLLGAGGEAHLTAKTVQSALRRHATLADYGLELRTLPDGTGLELRSRQVFLDPLTVQIAERVIGAAHSTKTTPASPSAAPAPAPQQVLAYFVNELRVGDRSTPYSMVAALPPPAGASATQFPPDLRDDEILLNAWLAADLHAGVGDLVTVKYYLMGPMRRLIEQSATFTVRAVLPMSDPACDRTLMPDFPGLAESENCRDWDPGIPIDLKKIRDQDETYWDDYRGTPKAFVALAAGQKLWRNRYGECTALRVLVPPAAAGHADLLASEQDRLAKSIAGALAPADFGLQPQPVGQQAQAASAGAQDFGGLFLGLSFFLIVAALILVGLLFSFHLQQRGQEVGLLLALGWTTASVRRLLLAEGGLLAGLGAVVGLAGGILYTRAVLYGLRTGWSSAVNAAEIQFAAQPVTLLSGAVITVLAAGLAMFIVLRGQFRRPIRELLHPGMDSVAAALPTVRASRRRAVGGLAGLLALGALILAGWAVLTPTAPLAETFFGVGTLVLLAGLAGCWVGLQPPAEGLAVTPVSLRRLSWRNTGLRAGRSLATIALLACGCFLVIAVSAGSPGDSTPLDQPASPAGGYRLYAELSLPVYTDLNTAAGRLAAGLDMEPFADSSVTMLRVHAGDDASCLNLHRAHSPRLLGVPAGEFDRRGAFQFVHPPDGVDPAHPWQALDRPQSDGAVPAIGDEATVYWALGLNVGDSFTYTDAAGGSFRIRIVGMLRNSVLQGALVLSEQALTAHFPTESGYRVLLVDIPADRSEAIQAQLSRGLRDHGCDLTTTAERLAQFSRVEQTYLAIFGLLGALGLLLGSVGLGLVLLRNVLERRNELALLRVLGFSAAAVRRLLWWEHTLLLGAGWLLGIGAALAAVAPTLLRQGGWQEHTGLVILLLALLALGGVSTALAARGALSGPLLDALRQE